jgi:hypothetical protein
MVLRLLALVKLGLLGKLGSSKILAKTTEA